MHSVAAVVADTANVALYCAPRARDCDLREGEKQSP